ncbi:MAG: tetratricopeptide repeat protein, partial [Myxococcales bacterium]|nr:tetratricopeptide repeat protein [Myxococcales bacterium]
AMMYFRGNVRLFLEPRGILSLPIMARGLLLILLLASCGTSREAFDRALAAGDRAKSAGRYDEAAAAYREAGDTAKRERDRDEGYFREAATLEQAGRYQEAMAAYDRLIALSPRGERTPRAVYERALLEVQHGDAEAGWQALERALLTYPSSGSARRVLRKVVEHHEEKAAGGGRRWLEANRERLLATELGEDTLYLIAKALQAEGRGAEARAGFVACAERYPYPYGALADDAWWNAAELAEQQGDYMGAVGYLQKLLAPREIATMKHGSYERPRYSAARFKLAELYRDRLGDDERAREEFRRLYREHTTSVLRDDALWNEILLARKAKDDRGVCDAMTQLVKEFPESRYAGCSQQLCASAGSSPKAPPCRGYLRSALGLE